MQGAVATEAHLPFLADHEAERWQIAVAARERQPAAAGIAREAPPRDPRATQTRSGTDPSQRDTVLEQAAAKDSATRDTTARTDGAEPAVSMWLLILYLVVVFLALDLGMVYAVLRTLASGSAG